MVIIKTVNSENTDFIELCKLLEEEHVRIIKEQRSQSGNCLKDLEKFKTVFIAYVDNKAVGCLAMKNIINDTIEVGRLYVLSEYRNLGIASNLFKNVEEYAKKLGAKRIILDTYNRFQAAVSLYKKLGFYKIDNYKENSPFSVCMEKNI